MHNEILVFYAIKWYGNAKPVKFKAYSNKKKVLIHKFIKKSSNNFRLYLYIPFLWNFFLTEKIFNNNVKNVFIFCDSYFFSIPIVSKNSNIKFFQTSRTLKFYFKTYNTVLYKSWKMLQDVFFSFSKIFFKKLKFKGKGHYIYKNKRNTIALKMGYSHLIRLYAFTVHMKFTAKTTIFMFGWSLSKLFSKGLLLRKLKPINIFTGRGIRFSKQIVYRKPGKISSYR